MDMENLFYILVHLVNHVYTGNDDNYNDNDDNYDNDDRMINHYYCFHITIF